MTKYPVPHLVAEIGCNHMGSIETAKELVGLAKLAGVTHIKFQKRTVRELLTPEQFDAPHPNPCNSFGESYGEHREFLEFNLDQHRELQEFCKRMDMDYSTSVWDTTAAREIASLAPSGLKVPSACNNNLELLRVLRDEFEGIVHLSFGMTNHAEEETAIALFEETGAARERLVVYSCTSGYPVPFADVCLLEIQRLQQSYGERVKDIGFSGHHLGIAIDIAAYTLGASWVERHFTKDRTWKGTDHAASLEPTGLTKLNRDLLAAHAALSFKPTEILEIEQVQRDKLKYQAPVQAPVQAGTPPGASVR